MRLHATAIGATLLRATVSAVVLTVSAPIVVAKPDPARLRATIDPVTTLAARDVSVAITRTSAPTLHLGKVEFALTFELKLADAVGVLDAFVVERSLLLADLAGSSEQLVKALGKALADSQASTDSAATFSVGKALADSQGISEVLTFNVSTGLADTQAVDDQINIRLGFSLTLGDAAGETEALIFNVGKALADTASSPSDALAISTGKALADAQGVADSGPAFNVGKRLGSPVPTSPWDGAAYNEVGWNSSTDDSLVWVLDLITTFHVGKALADNAGASSQITRFQISKPLSDSQSAADDIAKHVRPAAFADSQAVADNVAASMNFQRRISDLFTAPWNGEPHNESVWNGNEKGNAVYSTDLITSFAVSKVLSDTQGASDLVSIILLEFRDWNASAWNERQYN